jgi:hypothetical protein
MVASLRLSKQTNKDSVTATISLRLEVPFEIVLAHGFYSKPKTPRHMRFTKEGQSFILGSNFFTEHQNRLQFDMS